MPFSLLYCSTVIGQKENQMSLAFFKIAVRPDLIKKKLHIFRHDPNSSQGLSVNNFKFSFINTFRSTKS